MLEISSTSNGKCVSARELHKVLQLRDSDYSRNVNNWINNEYLFQGETKFRKPTASYDYSASTLSKSGRGVKAQDYLLRLEFAKLIALDSNSEFKKQFVQWLLALEQKVESNQLMSRDMILGLLEMSRLCMYIDNQIIYYNEHKKFYLQFVENNEYFAFDVWRNRILMIDNAKNTRAQYIEKQTIGKLKTKQEQVAFLHKLTSVRNALFDYLQMMISYNGNGDKTAHALDLANFTRLMLEKSGVDIDIKPRNYTPSLDFFRSMEEEFDMMLISKTILELKKK